MLVPFLLLASLAASLLSPQPGQRQEQPAAPQQAPAAVVPQPPPPAPVAVTVFKNENPEKREGESGIWKFAALLLPLGVGGVQVWFMWKTNDTAKRQMRAYLTVKPGKISHPDVWATTGVTGWLTITNTGQTPAYELTAMISMFTAPLDYDASEKLPLFVKGVPSKGVLGAGTNVAQPFPRDYRLSPETVEQLIAREIRLCIIATIRYTDAFKQKRYTNYSRYMEIRGGQMMAVGAETGNDAN